MTTAEWILFVAYGVGFFILGIKTRLNRKLTEELNDQLYNDELRLWALEPRVFKLEERMQQLDGNHWTSLTKSEIQNIVKIGNQVINEDLENWENDGGSQNHS